MTNDAMNRSERAIVVAFVGASGGSLVSSTCANVAAQLARAENRVLLIDLDPRGPLVNDLSKTRDDLSASPFSATVHHMRPWLDLMIVGTETTNELLAKQLEACRTDYDVLIIDGSGASGPLDNPLLAIADHLVVNTRPDRSSVEDLRAYLQLPPQAPVLGVIVAGVPVQPRGVLIRTRTNLVKGLDSSTRVFASTIRATAGVSWWARDHGLPLGELIKRLDHEQLSEATVTDALGLAKDYADVTEELIVRLAAPRP